MGISIKFGKQEYFICPCTDSVLEGVTNEVPHTISTGQNFIEESNPTILERLNPENYMENINNNKNNQQTESHLIELNLTDEEIISIIGPEFINERKPNIENLQIEDDNKTSTEIQEEKLNGENKFEKNVNIVENIDQDNEKPDVQMAINQEIKSEEKSENKVIDITPQPDYTIVHKWSTFLQKPTHTKPSSDLENSRAKKQSYRVKIRTKKDLEFEREMKKMAEIEALEKELNEVQSLNALDFEQDMIIAAYLFEEMEKERLAYLEELKLKEMQELEEQMIIEEEEELYQEESEDLIPDYSENISAQEVVLSLEQQLNQVKEQLLRLSNLPTTVQSTLSLITEQLQKISEEVKPTIEEDEDAVLNNSLVNQSEKDDNENTLDSLEVLSVDEEISEILENISGDIEENKIENTEEDKIDETELLKREEELKKMEKGQTEPVTPMERPIILSGGRKWTRPDDAGRIFGRSKLTDEKIDHTLTSFYEVVTGHTIGINFMKYDPPPKKLDHLQKSEVYKLIHSTDQGLRGIVKRSEKILAEEDYIIKKNGTS